MKPLFSPCEPYTHCVGSCCAGSVIPQCASLRCGLLGRALKKALTSAGPLASQATPMGSAHSQRLPAGLWGCANRIRHDAAAHQAQITPDATRAAPRPASLALTLAAD